MKTIWQEAVADNVIEKSRFIGHIRPVSTVEEAEAFIAQIRKQHWEATHNVPVYVVGERGECQKCSDDGEPSGTSGPPVMQMLAKEQITDVVIVITRYFGGVKLGTGGLVRAYTNTAKLALQKAGICDIKMMALMEVSLDYTYYGRLQNIAEEGGFSIEQADFSDVVTARLLMEQGQEDKVKNQLSEITLGSFQTLSCTFRLDKKLCQPGEE